MNIFHVNPQVDLWVLDVEGAELEVLESVALEDVRTFIRYHLLTRKQIQFDTHIFLEGTVYYLSLDVSLPFGCDHIHP